MTSFVDTQQVGVKAAAAASLDAVCREHGIMGPNDRADYVVLPRIEKLDEHGRPITQEFFDVYGSLTNGQIASMTANATAAFSVDS